MAENVDPFYIIDDSKNVQKIKLFISGSGADQRAIPYSLIEATGSTAEALQKISASLDTIKTRIESTTNPLYVSGSVNVASDLPKKVYKTIFTNVETTKKSKNIDWNTETSGTFRITTYDPTRKYVSIYNNSNSDLYLSMADEENISFTVDFTAGFNPDNLTFSFELPNTPTPIKVFEFTTEQLKNRYTMFTQTHINPADTREYGINIAYSTQKIGDITRVKISLTPEYSYDNLYKYAINPSDTGHFYLKMPEIGNIQDPDWVAAASTNFSMTDQNKRCYTKYNSAFDFSSETEEAFDPKYLNGFTLNSKSTPPVDFSYVIKGGDSIIIWEPEVVFGFYGFYPETQSELDVNVTEGF
jgi:hypothetical protein